MSPSLPPDPPSSSELLTQRGLSQKQSSSDLAPDRDQFRRQPKKKRAKERGMPWRSPRAFWTRFVLYGIAAGSLAILGGLNLAVQRAAPAGDRLSREALASAEEVMRDQLRQQIAAHYNLSQFAPRGKMQELSASEQALRVRVWTALPGQPRQWLADQRFPPDAQQQVIVSGSFAFANTKKMTNERHYLGTVYVNDAGGLVTLLCSSDRPLRPDVLQLAANREGLRCPAGSRSIALE